MTNETVGRAGWEPRVYLWDSGWLGIGRGQGIVPPHAHHAIQISISLAGAVRLREPEGEWSRYQGAIVQTDAPHSFDACGSEVAMLFLDPESHEGRGLRGSLRAPIAEIPPERLEACSPGLSILAAETPAAATAAGIVGAVVRGLSAGPRPVRPQDERIARALEHIRRLEASRIPIEAVAKAVFLSPSRFAHLFREEVGLPFRRYLLWRKLTRAMLEIGRGRTLTAAAHASGFADSAHLTRTFHQMFGMPPTVRLGRGEFLEIPAPFEAAPRAG